MHGGWQRGRMDRPDMSRVRHVDATHGRLVLVQPGRAVRQLLPTAPAMDGTTGGCGVILAQPFDNPIDI